MYSGESSEVWFYRYFAGGTALGGVKRLFSDIAEVVSPGDSVAVKVHMGEWGCTTHLRPALVRRVCDCIKDVGGRPFVTDTTTLYPFRRYTASKYLATAAFNGFSPETLQVPVVIADGEDGYDGEWVSVPRQLSDCPLERVRVAKEVVNADSMIVLSHVKGHDLSGFGGSIKNVAMGCVTKESKAAQHMANRALVDPEKCTGCGKCVEVCAYGALSVLDEKVVRDDGSCMNCGQCVVVCPEEVFAVPAGARERFQVWLAHAAAAVVGSFSGKVAFMNFVQDVTPLCDCATPSGLPVVPDVGILAARDVVAIDKASLDLIAQTTPIGAFRDIRSADVLGTIHETDSLVQIRTAEKLGLGRMAYELTSI